MKIGLLFFILSLGCLADGSVQLTFPSSSVKQGELIAVKATLNSAGAAVSATFRGLTVEDTLYVYSISPLMRKEGQDGFEAQMKVIFAKVPTANFLSQQIGAEKVKFSWDSVVVNPTTESDKFQFLNFSIPGRPEIIRWVLWILTVGLVSAMGVFGYRFWAKKQSLKETRKRLRVEILGCKSYEDVVKLWQRKHEYAKDFPHLTTTFPKLEETLFKYQFKPTQTDMEKQEVMRAYQVFVEEGQGGFDGV